jgi:hypothetical protein
MAVLLLASLSVSFALAVAEFTIGPCVVGVTEMVITADVFTGKLPIEHVTGPVPLHKPTVEIADPKVTPGGKASLRLTLVAVAGPLFVTVTR